MDCGLHWQPSYRPVLMSLPLNTRSLDIEYINTLYSVPYFLSVCPVSVLYYFKWCVWLSAFMSVRPCVSLFVYYLYYYCCCCFLGYFYLIFLFSFFVYLLYLMVYLNQKNNNSWIFNVATSVPAYKTYECANIFQIFCTKTIVFHVGFRFNTIIE